MPNRTRFLDLIEDAEVLASRPRRIRATASSLLSWIRRLEASEFDPQYGPLVASILRGKRAVSVLAGERDANESVKEGILTFATIIFQIMKISARLVVMTGQVFFLGQKIPGTILMIRDIASILHGEISNVMS